MCGHQEAKPTVRKEDTDSDSTHQSTGRGTEKSKEVGLVSTQHLLFVRSSHIFVSQPNKAISFTCILWMRMLQQ